MGENFDFKKEYKDLYLPKDQPMLVEVPNIPFIMVDGTGDPNNNASYQEAIEILYALSFTIKMSKMTGNEPRGYFEYIVPPLEGLWWISDDQFDFHQRNNWLWTSMIRQPEFVTQEVFDWAVTHVKKKKPHISFDRAKFASYTEGLCVQAMHIGPYVTEPETIAKMSEFIKRNNLIEDMISNARKHHEIYLSDPRKTAPEKMKTVLRHPVKRQ